MSQSQLRMPTGDYSDDEKKEIENDVVLAMENCHESTRMSRDAQNPVFFPQSGCPSSEELWKENEKETPASKPETRTTEFVSTTSTDDSSQDNMPKRQEHLSFLGFLSRLDRNALQFGTRMWFVLTLSSLFVLIPSSESGGGGYKQGTWAFVTTCIVSWFPTLNAALVIQKLVYRVMGTLVGAALGLGFGFLSVAVTTTERSSGILIGCVLSVVTWIYSVGVIQFKLHSQYSYSCMLGLFTFGLVLLPFHTDDDPKWSVGVWRVINVFVGCGIGAIGAVSVFPKSTHSQLQDELTKQISKAGESSCALLHASAEILSGRRASPTLEQVLEETKGSNDPYDELHETYCNAIYDWKKAKGLFPLLKYDPFMTQQEEKKEAFQRQSAVTLARAFRIQTTVVLLDSVLRNDSDNMKFTADELNAIHQIGSLVKTVLTVSKEKPTNQEVSRQINSEAELAADLLLTHLSVVRNMVIEASKKLSMEEEENDDLFTTSETKTGFQRRLTREDTGMPMAVRSSSKESTLLFLQLVEHLVMRALRLFYVWKKHGKQQVFFTTRGSQGGNQRIQ